MNTFSRRSFVRTAATSGLLAGFADLSFLSHLPGVSAAETEVPSELVALRPEIEPIARLIEDTNRDSLLEEMGRRVQKGLSYREVLSALLLAGVRNVEPKPVGFKFHAVLVVHASHLASIASADKDRWLPIFWALDYFKDSQARNKREGNWRMKPVAESAVPPAHKARGAFIDAMESWDAAAADAAISSLARHAGFGEIFELLWRYGARDFHEIGHKAIYTANTWRLLHTIGWQHAEPALRSLTYALLDHAGSTPDKRNPAHERPFHQNLAKLREIRSDWTEGKPSESGRAEMLDVLRQGSAEAASATAIQLLNKGCAPDSLWDAYFQAAGEILIHQKGGVVPLHSVTATNALHFAFQTAASDENRRLLLLQTAAWLTMFRGQPRTEKDGLIDTFEPAPLKAEGPEALDEIFAAISTDRMTAARKALAYLKDQNRAHEMMTAARRFVFLKGRDAHDYKFSSAVLEDYYNVSPAWRARYLAASVFNLTGSAAPDNKLVQRIAAALG